MYNELDILTKEEHELLEELMIYKLPNRVYKYYINAVKGNESIDYKTARKKIIRNIILGKRNKSSWTDTEECKVSYYGNLAILYDTDKKSIVWIKNYTKEGTDDRSTGDNFQYIDKANKKEWLNNKLGIGTK